MYNRFIHKVAGIGMLCSLWLLAACTSERSEQEPGIALSFDDRFVDEWFQLRPLFKQYNAHVTFYITQFDSLSTDELTKLKILQQEGHEIACHGAIHTNAVAFLKDHSLTDYMNAEVYPELRSMKQQGFRPTSFAFPGGAHTNAVDQELLRHFILLRDVAMVERRLWGVTLHWPVSWLSSIYYHFDGDPLTDALLFDEGAGLADDELKTALDKTKLDHSALMLFGHKPYVNEVPKDGYGFLTKRLTFILAESNRRNLKTYTMSELVKRSKQKQS